MLNIEAGQTLRRRTSENVRWQRAQTGVVEPENVNKFSCLRYIFEDDIPVCTPIRESCGTH